MRVCHLACVLLAVFALGSLARAQTVITIRFDDIPALSKPLEQYSGLGVHFSDGAFGAIQGISAGDPGNWSLDGTDGPQFLGFNSLSGYAETVTLDFPVAFVALDVSRANGSSAGQTFTLSAYNASSVMVGTQTITLAAINSWTTVSLYAPGVTRIDFSSSNNFGVDRLQFSTVPESSTWALLASGLISMTLFRRRFRG